MRSMVQKRGTLVVIIAGVLFLMGLFAGLWLPGFRASNAARNAYNTSTVLRQVQTLSELVTVKYVMEKVVILEVPPESVLGQMFAGDNRLLLLAHGIVKAGVDLADLNPEDVRVEGKTVYIKLPKPKITDAYLDETQTRVIERTTGRFRSFDKNLEQSARQNAVDDIKRAARSGGIVKDAQDRARIQLETFFQAMGMEARVSSPN